MGTEPDPEPSSPKLSFYSLPRQPTEPAGMLTPPFRPSASVPFVWEEAPGRPRTCDSKPASARCLDLPPRLLTEMIITSLPSPTTVLEGPYVGRSVSCSSFREAHLRRSFKGGSHRSISPEEAQLGTVRRKEKERGVGFWGKRVGKVKGGPGMMNGDVDGSVVLSSSPSSSSSFGERYENPKVKITRFRRNRSLLNVSSPTTTHFWASIYGSFKQVLPWRTRKLKN
ncbi:uncharacterized protein At4g00950-like [Magnolia sinica]|uniref:uncharacterized protein At4g00950-like n=1 Tax=Magnolia sinica TaxID=86752 RepID=UPI002658454E|nr:uncharacterized protein At4g00950-like [Magnolia sinica]